MPQVFKFFKKWTNNFLQQQIQQMFRNTISKYRNFWRLKKDKQGFERAERRRLNKHAALLNFDGVENVSQHLW